MYRGKYSNIIAPTMPDWVEKAVIYEVNVRQFTAEGTFVAFERHLSRLKELGVTVLWFMPIHPIGKKNRKGQLGSYYSIQDYYDINPEFGSLTDFKNLVKKIHDLEMFVIIDLVANHTAWDNPLLAQHPDWYTHDENGVIVSPLPDWHDVADLNYNNPELRRYMSDMMLYWIREINIDGFRCDVAELVPANFWRETIARLQEVKPVFMLAEGQHPSLHASGFFISYAFNMYWLFNGIVDGSRDVDEIDKLLDIDRHKFPKGSRRLRFTSNHDQNSWFGSAIERLGDAAEVFALLTFTLPGTPLIYNGQESGNTKRLAFYEKDEIEWKQSPFTPFYQQLCRLYQSHPALFKGDKIKIQSDNHDRLYAFKREDKMDQVLVFTNLSSKAIDCQCVLTNIHGEFIEIFEKKIVTLKEKFDLSLAPWGYRLYIKK